MSLQTPLVSVITPAWNEARNLPVLYERLRAALAAPDLAWEWIIVDDHSEDATFDAVRDLAATDVRVRGVRLARNVGSHAAIACGLDEAQGDAAVVLAADLQDPPEKIPALLSRWRSGAQVVWASRRRIPGQRRDGSGFSLLYYWLMRRVVGMRQMPVAGADFFLVDRAVIDAFRHLRERHTSVLALITWLGFRQDQVEYDKQPRLHGTSGWSLRKKLKLVFDSITGFSDLPVMACWTIGLLLTLVGLLLGIAGLSGFALGVLAPAHVVLLGAIGGASGVALVMLGIVGEYVWRALDEARRRPRYFIESRAPIVDHEPAHR
jgi:glycosyltransferase involved in cell wall biosynthesis